MKNTFKKLLVSVLSLSLLVGTAAMTAFAEEPAITDEPIIVDMEKSGFDEEAGAFNLYLTISSTASGDLTVNLAPAAIKLLNDYAEKYGYSRYPILPGDSNLFNVYINNESSHEYAYEQGSLKLTTQDVSSSNELSPFTGFDGKKIPYSYIGSIPASNKAIYKELFGVSGSSKVTSDMMFGVYDYLAAKGFEGPTALTDYMLAYYSKLYNTNYSSWDELVAANPNLGDTFAQAGSNSIFKMPFSKMKAYCAEHPELEPFVYYTSASENPADGDEVQVQIKWPEKDLAVFSYNIFYQDYFSFAFGEEEIALLNPNRNTEFTRAHGVGDYMDASSELYKTADSYFSGLENADSLTDGEILAFAFMWALDGPGVGNGYQMYKFSYQHSIALTQLDGEEEIPDDDPPLVGPADPEEEVPDEEVPLAPPATGDSTMAIVMGIVLIAAAAGAVLIRRRAK